VDKGNVVNALLTWRTKNPAAVVILKGDKSADFGTISDVMLALADSKTLRFNLMTDLKDKGGARSSGEH
jgi:biopolymer transport protein ExbD